MPSPFPGMDPWLEAPEIWRGFHHHVAEEIMRQLNPRLGPRYYADVEVTLTIDDVRISSANAVKGFVADAGVLERSAALPTGGTGRAVLAIPEAPVRRDVALAPPEKLRAVHVREARTDRLVTSIEILSPWNKRRGEGLETYRRKRDLLLRSPVHLVEIDFLRAGERPGPELSAPPLACDYVILVNRANGVDVRTSEIWPLELSDPLPVVPVPLGPSDPDVPLELDRILVAVYDAAGYGRRVDYASSPPPPLREGLETWLAATVRDARGEGNQED